MSENNSKNIINNEGKCEDKTNYNKVITNYDRDDYSGDKSPELFSDYEETNIINECSPQRSMDDCSFLNSFKTPVLHSDVEENVSNLPVIPKTPASLAPFIYKNNEPWTSELETPDAKLVAKLQTSSKSGDKCWKNVDGTSKRSQTPILEKIQTENNESVSPILSSNKKMKPKRQIFKSKVFENFEITPSFENILKTEESTLNVDVVKKSESLIQDNVSNDSNVISTINKNSSPKCIDNKTKKLPTTEATTSTTKSLLEKFKEVKSIRGKEENFEIAEINISDNVMLKNVIQLERASRDFSNSTKKNISSINEIGLVPFSQYFKDENEKSFNKKINDISEIKENTMEKDTLKEISTTKSPILKCEKQNSTETPQKKKPKESSFNEEDIDYSGLNFSQWLYKSDDSDENIKDEEKINEIENKKSKNLTEIKTNVEIKQKFEETELEDKMLFQEMDSFDFEQNFKDELTPKDLIKQSNLDITKSCGFSTASGRSIKINKDKLKQAEKMYQEIEINQNLKLKTNESEFSEIASSSKENDLSLNLKTNFTPGFATARGNKIVISQEKLSKAQKIYNEIELNLSDKETISSSKENHVTDLNVNYNSGFATAGGKKITISNEKLSNAQKMYSEIELNSADKEAIDKENQVKFSSNQSLFNNNKTPLINTNIQTKTEYSNDIKRKIIDGNTNHSKRFKPLAIPRDSPIFNRQKNISKIENNAIQKEEFVKNQKFENFNKSDDLIIKDENSKLIPRKTFSLPINSENKNNFNMNERLSLPTSFKNKISEPLNPESPPFHGFSMQRFSSAVTKLNSSPFYGFSLSDMSNSNVLCMKFQILVEKLKNNLENEENIISTSEISNIKIIKEKEKISTGFSTAGGKKIKIDSNFNANLLFNEINQEFMKIVNNESIIDNDFSKIINIDRKNTNKNNENLMKKVVNLNFKQELENSNNSQINKEVYNRKQQWSNILKRSIDDVDDNTPLGRNDNSKKPKLNYDFHGKKLFTEGSISDDEMDSLLNQPGSSSSKREKKIDDHNNPSILTADLINDSIVSEELFKPFTKEITNYSELNNDKEKMEIEEKNDFPDEVPRSPVLGKSKVKRRRRSKMIQPIINDSENLKMEKFNSINSDCSLRLQTLDTESLICNSEILEKRIAATLELDKIISIKRKEKPKPMRGNFLTNREEYKKSRISLYKLANGSAPKLRSEQELKERGINPDVLNVTASTAEFYKFRIDIINESARRNLVSLKIGDGATLVPNENGFAGVEEFETSFEASPGVDPSLLPRGWLRNHYRWIVWKLASMDRIKLGSLDIPRMLTPDRVMKDLKYRYDREIDRSQRPAIRKILEKDDVSSKRMILCISTISESMDNEKDEKDPRILLRTPRWKIEVTDGWYSIPVSFDTAMMKNIIDGKIQEGTKIITYGAELNNCNQGCYPLEKPGNIYLTIHTNSTRRARWDAKLGFQRISGPISSNLKVIDPNGGFIGQINVIVSRIYPIMYREKTADGQTIYRNEKQEEKAAMAYNHEREKKAEKLYAEAQKKLEGAKNDSSEEDSAGFLTNFDSFHNLSEAQRNKLLYNRQVKVEKLKIQIDEEVKASHPPRNVIPVRKIRIVDGEICAILTIWSTSDDVNIFKEGNCYSIFNVNAYGRRDGELHLTASRQAIFKSMPNLNKNYPCRQFTSLQEISVPGFEPPYSELDTVGVVSWIGNTPHGMKNFDAICIAYPNEDSSSTYLLIMFWQGISSYGFSSILTVGSLIGCSNLEIRKTRSASNISLCYCSERTVFTRNPRQAHLLSAFEFLNKEIKDIKAYATTCGEEISTLIQKKPISRISGQGIMNSADRNSANSPHFMVAKTPIDVDTPAKSSVNQKRLERLARYGQPPELSPMVFKNSSSVRSSFRPLFGTPNSTKLTKPRPDTT